MNYTNELISIGPRALSYPNPVMLIATFDENKIPDIMAASWYGICCSEPPCVNVSVRKARKTYDNLILNNCFTVLVPSEEMVMEADFTGIYSGHKVDKCKELDLKYTNSEIIDAPVIEGFPILLECKVINKIELGSHTQFIGRILDIKVNKSLIENKKIPTIKDVKPFVYDSGTRAYYSIGKFLGDAYKIGLKSNINT
ncbi:MAG: hypothetical protein A2X64_02335 [Ignavibacteria bacterium GWF2_33_9]|nr:MAG: hypothetical protein A2X64_02335 [Ignavibacteria bacterium GWF2_33_9]